MAFLAGIELGVAANFVTKAIEAVAKSWTADRWQQADEKTRLFTLLEGAYGDELPAFTLDELARTWGTDSAFLDVYDRLSAGAEPETEREALARAIEPLVGPTATETPRQLAERVAVFLPYLIPHSKQASERVLYAIRQVANLMKTQHEATSAQLNRIEAAVGARSARLILSSDWPLAPEDALRCAIEADPQGVANLDEALGDKDRTAELATLVRNPRGWMTSLKAEAWELIAVSCEERGLWPEADQAWLKARELPGADFAGCSVRAAEAAFQAGERDGARALMDEARADDPTHPRVVLQDALAQVFADPRASAKRAAELADESLRLEADLRARHQLPQAAEARVQASAHSLIGDYGTARALLADAVDIYRDEQPEARLAVAMAAATVESYDTVRALVQPDDDRACAQYLRAVLKARGDEEPDVVAAVAELEGLLDSEHARIRDLAAFERLLLAGRASGIGWSERAAAVVAEHDPSSAVVLKAFWLERTGQITSPYSGTAGARLRDPAPAARARPGERPRRCRPAWPGLSVRGLRDKTALRRSGGRHYRRVGSAPAGRRPAQADCCRTRGAVPGRWTSASPGKGRSGRRRPAKTRDSCTTDG